MACLTSREVNAEPRPRAAKLWTATYLLMGLRYSLLEGVQTMQESDDRNEGSIAEAQRMRLRLGTKPIRDPNPATSLRSV